MPIYEFKCKNCGSRESFPMSIAQYEQLGPQHCWQCEYPLSRVYTPPALPRPAFEPGFNPSFGRYFDSERQMKTELDRMSEERTKRTGIEHSFATHDARDTEFAKQAGVGEQGMEATERKRREMGLTERGSFG